ncbi:hypothetical protein [Bacillus sp. FJAT-52991]|uniref:Lipoprotein n=1 Tax=Bacillus kandeliae TaxID=3129297 RepID=A0ABZ2N4N2_9BACI
MSKLIRSFACLSLSISLLFGCNKDETDLDYLSRVDVEITDKEGPSEMITEDESVEELREIFQKIKWDEDDSVQMPRKEDVKATLFLRYNENEPERLVEYSISFHQQDDNRATIIDHDKEYVGALDQENSTRLKEILLK